MYFIMHISLYILVQRGAGESGSSELKEWFGFDLIIKFCFVTIEKATPEFIAAPIYVFIL